MRASHRRLYGIFSTANLFVVALLLLISAVDARAHDSQSIRGVPGDSLSAASGLGVSDNKLGSVLFFNYYTSNSNSSTINTRIAMTNVNPDRDVTLHIFIVDTATCNIADNFMCLTRNETAVIYASDIDPNVTGYLIAVAVDAQGRPMGFNYLAGDELIVAPTGHRFGLPAMAAARRDGDYASSINSDGVTSTMFFDGKQYDYLPFAMMIDNFPSQVSGLGSALANTQLFVYTPLPDLTVGDSSFSGSLFVLVSDDKENTYSGQLPITCSLSSDKQRVTSIRTSPPINTIVPAGHSGWLRFWGIGKREIICNTQGGKIALSNVPLMGATATTLGAYNGGHNLRYLSLFNTPGYSITVPIIPPPCGPNVHPETKDSCLCEVLKTN